jgi:hypothetical protein
MGSINNALITASGPSNLQNNPELLTYVNLLYIDVKKKVLNDFGNFGLLPRKKAP